MNALRATIPRNVMKTFAKRYASAQTAMPKPPVPDCYLQHNFRTDYLSDPSTYPIIGVMCFATLLVLGMSANTMMNDNHDLRILPGHKQAILRTWGDDKVYDKMAHKFALGPILMHEKDYRTIWQEGLGVNHEEWLKRKQEQEASLSK